MHARPAALCLAARRTDDIYEDADGNVDPMAGNVMGDEFDEPSAAGGVYGFDEDDEPESAMAGWSM